MRTERIGQGSRGITLPRVVPYQLRPWARLEHRDLGDTDGRRSECPGRLRRGRQLPSERRWSVCRAWRCGNCGALVLLDLATGLVVLDASGNISSDSP